MVFGTRHALSELEMCSYFGLIWILRSTLYSEIYLLP